MTPDELKKFEALQTSLFALESLHGELKKKIEALEVGRVAHTEILEGMNTSLNRVFKTIKYWENKLGKSFMPKGTFCGVEF